jgi:hypothetical protein
MFGKAGNVRVKGSRAVQTLERGFQQVASFHIQSRLADRDNPNQMVSRGGIWSC